MKIRPQQIIIGSSLVLLMTFLFFKTNVIESDTHNRFSQNLRYLKELEATLDKDILESRYGFSTTYDLLTTEIGQVNQLQTNLKNVPSFLGLAEQKKINDLLNEFDDLENQKQSLIERFKSRNAIINNSLRYLPIVTAKLLKNTPENSSQQKKLEPLNYLQRDILTYYLLTDSELEKSINNHIEQLQNIPNEKLSTISKTDVDIAISHARTILKLKPEVDELVKQILLIQTAGKVEQIIGLYDSYYADTLQVSNIYRLLLYIFSVFLLVYIVFIIFKLKKTTLALNAVNENLEQSVQKRTKELLSSNTELRINITERKQIEDSLRTSEARFQSAFEYAPIGIGLISPNGLWRQVNHSLCEIIGYSKEELMKSNFKRIMHPSDVIESRKYLHKLLADDSNTYQFENRYIHKNGYDVIGLTSLSLARDGQNNPLYFIAQIQDISERKRIESEIKANDFRLSEAQRIAHLGSWEWNITKNKVMWSDELYRIFGLKPLEFDGTYETYLKFIHPDDLELVKNTIERAVEEKNYQDFDHRIIQPDGTVRFIHANGIVEVDEFDTPIKMTGTVQDITERKQTEEELKSREAQLAEAQHVAHLGSWEWDIKPNTHLWSDEWYRILGHQPQEFTASYEAYLERVHPEDLELVMSIVQKALQEKEYPSFEHRIVRPDGTVRTIHADGKIILNEKGKAFKMLGIIIDVTEQKQIEAELEQARDIALESVRLKSEFLANMSHEIRTPMNGVIGMTGLLLDTDLTEEQRDFAKTTQSSADALLRIIDDILDFSKIEAGQLHFEKIDFDLRESVESPIELLAERAQSKGVEIASLVYGNVPTLLCGDPGRLRQILTNLIGNAIKFTEKGEVTVNVQKQSEAGKYVSLRFEVTDTGIGISEQAQSRLFRAFTQADGSTTRKYGGTGLGLAISKQLVEMMGGEIGIDSVPGKGSTFWFTARLEKQPEQTATIQTFNDVSLEGVRVLIVDDNATNRKIFTHQTSSWGMIPIEADSGKQALEMLREAVTEGKPFEIAILDFMMPEMDGFELAQAIKSDLNLSKTHLVLLPSYGKRGDGQLAKDFGIAAYLQKPVRQSQLYNCLMKVIAETSGNKYSNYQSSQLITKHSLHTTPSLNIETKIVVLKARILIAEDNAVNQKVAISQLKSLGYAADVAVNGREAVNAIEKNQYDVILMDCQMPEMDGFEATAEIRRIEGDSNHTTIIAMTAHALEGEREKCLAAGMDDYISKPVKKDILKQKLEQWIVTSLENEVVILPTVTKRPNVSLDNN